MTEYSEWISETAACQVPDRFPVEVRRCNYLCLKDAVRVTDSDSSLHFQVPALVRWVAVLRQFDGGWIAIRPIFSDVEIAEERKLVGLQADLGKLRPPPEEKVQWIVNIPERYHVNLLLEATNERGNSSPSAHVQFTEPADVGQKAARPSAELRYCYYLHLDSAKKMLSQEGEPVLSIRAKARWVLVRRYLRDDWAQIYQLTSDNVTANDHEKRFHVHLGKIVPKSSEDTWAQCILERYPSRLMRDAEHDYKKTKRNLEPLDVIAILKTIDSGSPDHWMVARPALQSSTFHALRADKSRV